MKGLEKLIQKSLVAKFGKDSEIGKALESSKPGVFLPDAQGKISVYLSGGRTLKLDLSESKISSALYGEVMPDGKQNAVCLNVATLIEPKIKGEIWGRKDTIVPGTPFESEISISDTIVGLPGEVKTSDVGIIGFIPEEKPKPIPPTTTP